MTRETVLITGASSGIGRELARCFARDGSDLLLVARRQDRLSKLAHDLSTQYSVAVRVLPKDLTCADAASEIVNDLDVSCRTVDVLVNNAGFGAFGPLCELELDLQLDMIRLNALALTELTRSLLPGMVSRGRGGILNVASTAAFQPGPNMAVYYATKAYVLSLTEALAEELRTSSISVSCLCPGPTKTEFAAKADAQELPLFKMGVMEASDVARQGYDGFRARKTVVIPGAPNKVGTCVVRFTPRSVVRRLVKAMQPAQ